MDGHRATRHQVRRVRRAESMCVERLVCADPVAQHVGRGGTHTGNEPRASAWRRSQKHRFPRRYISRKRDSVRTPRCVEARSNRAGLSGPISQTLKSSRCKIINKNKNKFRRRHAGRDSSYKPRCTLFSRCGRAVLVPSVRGDFLIYFREARNEIVVAPKFAISAKIDNFVFDTARRISEENIMHFLSSYTRAIARVSPLERMRLSRGKTLRIILGGINTFNFGLELYKLLFFNFVVFHQMQINCGRENRRVSRIHA